MPPAPLPRTPLVLEARGVRVMLDSEVAARFGTDTKRVNEAVARNPAKFDDRHVFQLSDDEHESLRSQLATSSGHGGRRYPPRVFTLKGIARLATILNTPEALHATDLIIDTFLSVQHQIAAGAQQLRIENPSLYLPSEDPAEAAKFRRKLIRAMETLLDSVVDPDTGATVSQTARELGLDAVGNLRERMRSKGLENEKLEAETLLILKQVEQVTAEVRRTNAEAASIEITNVEKRIGLVRQLVDMHRQVEPPAIVEMLTRLEQQPSIALAPPTPDQDESGPL
jgi:hypothetical protein